MLGGPQEEVPFILREGYKPPREVSLLTPSGHKERQMGGTVYSVAFRGSSHHLLSAIVCREEGDISRGLVDLMSHEED